MAAEDVILGRLLISSYINQKNVLDKSTPLRVGMRVSLQISGSNVSYNCVDL